ncbi:hypothetical protein ES703_91719 [subsurface metagenome]
MEKVAKMKNVDKRFALFLVMLFVFVAWIGVIFVWLLPIVLEDPDTIDPMLTLTAGLGVGGISQFFILVLKDGWQFYFRKKPQVEQPSE